MRLWKRRSAAAESRQADTPPDATPAEASRDVPTAFRPATAPDLHAAGEPAPVPQSQAGPAPGHAQPPARTVRGRVLHAEAAAPHAGQPPHGGQTLPAVTTVTAYRRDGAVTGSTVSEDGSYVLDGLPAEPLTLVAVEHPAVHEEVVVRAGDQRHDIALPAFPRRAPR
ncbi:MULTISPECIES: carboxypeptidase-like regulatory domain-containing protein [Prauserella salsuginis group]|uniref:Carboxypeptidase regulatory-like domain-containing protein n=2 Tax=Prauserella salsuginis group TaxID=2893672 RepID=A0A839XI83_9PSEU|nr:MULTISPECIES: carboxypeptidase-like regulatory domain-containing protein [Prauserella salsuginis group]MBB3662207.1 hypothetical protein [Prauserella sediminis]MCR3719898.1 hypothetical protein [Prauserella flava]MCR3736559.1 hypothetical protein [Prauserella salsuginis]